MQQKKVDVNAQDKLGLTPLHNAAGGGFENIVRLLLAREALVEVGNDYGETPLRMAQYSNHPGVIAFLCSAGAEVNIVMPFGDTPLHNAARKGQRPVVALLLELGADRSFVFAGQVAHTAAAFHGHEEIAQLLSQAVKLA